MSSIRALTFAAIAIAVLLALGTSAADAAVPIATFSIPNPRSNEYLGLSVATDGQRVLLGTGSGTAYLFDPFTQQQLAKVTMPDPRFDTSVALQGNSGVVGTRGDAIVYDFSNLPVVTSKPLVPSDSSLGSFGVSVGMSGDSIIVGANDEDSQGNFTGAAYLFNRVTGVQYAKLLADDGRQGDNFGISVAIDGNLAVVGSTRSMDRSNSEVYQYDAQPGVIGNRQLDKYAVSPANPDPGDSFGYGVEISGNRIMALESQGRVFLWPTAGEPAPLPFTQAFHSNRNSISLDGQYEAVGLATFGYVNFYDASGTFLRSLYGPADTPIGFGAAVAIGGGLVVVSAPGGAPTRSVVYVYRLQDIVVPEPSTTSLALGGLLAVVFKTRRGRRLRS